MTKLIKYKIILFIITLLFYENISAQMLEGYESSTIRIEAKKGTSKKNGTGYFFGFTTAKDNSSYSAIIVNKDVINDSESIQLFFMKEKANESDKPETYIYAIPNNKEYVFYNSDTENKLAMILMSKIYNELEKKGIGTSEVYLFPNYIEMLQIPISEKDLLGLKENLEKQLKK